METATMMTEEPEEERSSPVNDANSPPSSESPAPDITTTETAKEASLQVIKRKLSAAGLIDIEANKSSSVKLGHRRSRSLNEVFPKATISVSAGPPAVPEKPSARSLKLSTANIGALAPHIGLEEIKRNLLLEIKTKLQKQIDAKTTECHKEIVDLNQVSDSTKESTNSRKEDEIPVQEKSAESDRETESIVASFPPVVTPSPTTTVDDNTNKRFSICSLSSGVELRKRYSPVYERTRKIIVRQSSSSINRLSSSQPQVEALQQQPKQRRTAGPSSPAVSVDTNGTVAVLSPVASKGDLEDSETVTDKMTEESLTKTVRDVPEQFVDVNTSSSGKLGGYSAHPSVYVIEQDRRIGGSTGLSTSRSDKMDSSTNTLKRRPSLKGLRKNIRKTFSTNIPALTLEKADKSPGCKVPAIVTCCVETLRRKGFLKTEGLYRSSPSQLEVRKVIKHARKGQYDYVRSVDDPVLLAGTLKSFFFNLKQHVIGEEVMEKNFPKKCLLGNMSENEYIERLKGVVVDLDDTHYESLEYIIKHLHEVASYNKFNLMTAANLGVVWSPCLFTNCDKMDSADLLSFMGEQTRLLEMLIINADTLFDRDQYQIDEIIIALEDGTGEENGGSTLNQRPNYDLMLGDDERRKLFRNLSLTLENLCEATNAEVAMSQQSRNGNPKNGNGRNYDLQNSFTVPTMTSAQSDGIVPRKAMKMKRSKSRAVCVLS